MNIKDNIEGYLIMKKMKQNSKIPKPTQLHISTRSAVSKYTSSVNIFKTFEYIINNILDNIVDGKNTDYLICGICFSKYRLVLVEGKKNKKKNNIVRENLDDIIKDLHKNSRGHFYNQCSIIIRPELYKRPVTLKLFTNGSMSMSGCLYEKDGLDAVKLLYKELIKYNLFEEDDVTISRYKITMINSDFNLNFKVNRNMLFKKMTNLGILTNYDPDNYPGVKILYFWNNYEDGHSYGVCKCKNKCNGKGDGDGDGKCKKVTIPVFSSGSVLITGGNTEKQVIDSHNFLNKCIKKIYKDIVNFTLEDYFNIINSDDYKNNVSNTPKQIKSKKTPKSNEK
tara:strand:+ start:79 stop:1092 length:1014 start_codon:yes stop_codon:yes gene_type:complete